MRRTVMWLGWTLLATSAGPVLGQELCGPVGQHAIHVCVYDADGPTMVLAAGAGQSARTWDPLVEDLTTIARVVTFDRPGLGRSPEVEGARTPTAIARELHDLLTSLGVSGPTFFVGHSMGGIHVLRYAELFPESVAGVVLLDAPPPGFEEHRMGLLSPSDRDARRATLAQGRARAPSIVGRERDGAASESRAFERFPAEAPLLVAVADSQDFGELGSQEAHRSSWRSLSRGWLDLSPHSELIIATGSGHMIHHDRAPFVLGLIRRMVEEHATQEMTRNVEVTVEVS